MALAGTSQRLEATAVGRGGDARPFDRRSTTGAGTAIEVAGVSLQALAEGALWWAEERLLVVADLHLEKASSFARRGQFLPPYDTGVTLAALGCLIAALQPRVVVALGDSFHDDDGAVRLGAADKTTLAALQSGREWIWIAGNHDRVAPAGLGGASVTDLALGPLVFRHEPRPHASPGEIAGHLHPAARVASRLGSVRRRCFIGDGTGGDISEA